MVDNQVTLFTQDIPLRLDEESPFITIIGGLPVLRGLTIKPHISGIDSSDNSQIVKYDFLMATSGTGSTHELNIKHRSIEIDSSFLAAPLTLTGFFTLTNGDGYNLIVIPRDNVNGKIIYDLFLYFTQVNTVPVSLTVQSLEVLGEGDEFDSVIETNFSPESDTIVVLRETKSTSRIYDVFITFP